MSALALQAAAPVAAQTLVVGIGSGQSTTRVVSFDTSFSVAGDNLLIPGAINATPVMPVTDTTVMPARLAASGGGATQVITASLADGVGLAPAQVVRHTGGEGLVQVRSATAGPTVLGIASSVPAVTGLGMGQTRSLAVSVDLGSFTVFP